VFASMDGDTREHSRSEEASSDPGEVLTASITSEVHEGDELTLSVSGRLTAETVGEVWRQAFAEVDRVRPQRIVVEAAGVEYCDGIGAAFFSGLRGRAAGGLEIRSLAEEYQPLLGLFDATALAPVVGKKPPSVIEGAGRATVTWWQDVFEMVSFVGEALVGLVWAIRNPRQVPWRDAVVIAETAGVNAFFIVSLVGFLLGLIMSFQSAVPMQQFGAEIFVADLVGISMLKELGPLMTAIILAGRSGSAFAAELGTMKVNEEIDALKTMGLDPVRYLVITRVLAAFVMTPILSVFCSLFALVGGAVVIRSLGYPLVTYVDRVVGAVSVSVFLSGVIKSFVYAILVAGVGCLRGLQTGTGARAVGESTTSAVVTGIILIALASAVFSVILYALKI
jgi:phospholipid/cholesterol/gamma-HCH transport system permease protein